MTDKMNKIAKDRGMRFKIYNGLFKAEDPETGLYAYGETKDEAVQNVMYRIEDMKNKGGIK